MDGAVGSFLVPNTIEALFIKHSLAKTHKQHCKQDSSPGKKMLHTKRHFIVENEARRIQIRKCASIFNSYGDQLLEQIIQGIDRFSLSWDLQI